MALITETINNAEELYKFVEARKRWDIDFEFDINPTKFPVVITYTETQSNGYPIIEYSEEYPIDWESIDTAPKNGIVIISDEGFIKWVNDVVISEVDSIGWYSTHPNGQIKHEYENIQYSYPIKASPTVWLRITVPKIK